MLMMLWMDGWMMIDDDAMDGWMDDEWMDGVMMMNGGMIVIGQD